MAKKTVKEVVTKWGFQVDKKPLEDMKKSIAGVKANLFALGASALGSATAIFGLAEHTAEAANEMRFAAARAGMSTKAFQEMSFAAKMSGVSSESFGHAMAFLNRNMYAARTGSKEAGAAFFQLGGGIGRAIQGGANNSTVFKMVADRMKGINDPAKKGALAMQIFGRAGVELMPLLNQGAKGIDEFSKKAEEMGIVLSDDTIKDAEEFHETMEELKGNLLGFKNTIGSALIGPVNEVMKIMAKWMSVNREFINSQVKQFVMGLKTNIQVTALIFEKLLKIVTAMVRPFGGLGSALKVVVTAFTAIKAINLLSSLGQMVQAVWKLGLAWKAEAAWAGIADALTAAIPIAIGAAVVILGLAIEDLYGYFNGKNSVFGKIVAYLTEKFPAGMKVAKDMIGVLVDDFKAFASAISKVWEVLEKGYDIYQKISGPKVNVNGPQGVGAFGGGDPMAAFRAPGPGPATIANAAGGGNSATTIVNAPINVNVPPGTSPEMVGPHVQEGVSRAMEKMLRGAQRAHAPMGAF